MLKGKKIILESVEEEHLDQFRIWRNDPDLRKYFREHREISKYMQSKWFERISNDKNQFNFSIKEKETSNLIGHCGLYYIDWVNRTGEFGIYIGDEKYRSGGYGSDSLRCLIKYGFSELNLNKIWCEVFDNNKSISLYKRLGFAHEGTMREHYYNDGKYWDSHFLSLLKRDWETQK